MQLVVTSDAGDVVRQLSDVERGRVAEWVLDSSVQWNDSAPFPGKDTVVMIRGDHFQVFIANGEMIICGHAIGYRGRATPVPVLTDVLEP
jgi:hypothetical protein